MSTTQKERKTENKTGEVKTWNQGLLFQRKAC